MFKAINDSYEIVRCSNGYMITVSGITNDDHYLQNKMVVLSLEELVAYLKKIESIPLSH
jgi:7,8-dihydro-6-hydroxymethylpterin-pyrophosphokinase